MLSPRRQARRGLAESGGAAGACRKARSAVLKAREAGVLKVEAEGRSVLEPRSGDYEFIS